MAELTVQNIVRTGLEATLVAAAAGGDEFDNDGRTMLFIKNAAVADITLTIDPPGLVDGNAIANPTVVVTAAEERLIGPFPPSIYNDADGHVNVTYTAVVTVTVAALRLP